MPLYALLGYLTKVAIIPGRRKAESGRVKSSGRCYAGSGIWTSENPYLLGTSVNKPAVVRRAALPYRSMPALESSWNQENDEYNRGGKRNHEKTKETMKAMA